MFVSRLSGSACRTLGAAARGSAALALLILPAACGADSPTTPSPPPGPCVYAISTASVSFAVTGGSTEVRVQTANHCSWTARTEAGWLSITGGAAGMGPGVVTIAATPNPATSERDATIVIAELPVAVRQECLAACTYAIDPSTRSIGKDEGAGTFAVSAASHCPWTAASETSWLTVTSGTSGSGDGSVGYLAGRNTAPTGRTGTIAAAGLTFTLNQDGDPGGCQYSVSPVTFSPCMTSGDLTSTIATEPGCPWTASPAAAWITIVAGESGSGPGVVTFRVGDNWEPPRTGVVMIRWPAPTEGQNLQVAQAGCYYSVSRSSIALGADGGSSSVDVYQQSDPIVCGGPLQNACLWTAVPDVSWITITTALPRRGDDRLAFTVAPNDGPLRSGTIRVRDQVVRIDQAGR